MEIKEVEITKLKFADYNPREISKQDFESLKRSLGEFGPVEPAVVNKNNMIVGGHMRIRAAKGLGWSKFPCYYVDLSDAKAKALNLALNRIHGDWDKDKLDEILYQLNEMEDLDIELTGFSQDEIDQMKDRVGVTEEDEAPDVEEGEPKSKLGEVYQLGNHRLMCGDATKIEDVEKLMDGKKADMVFTDPPYGLGGYGGRNNMELKGDDEDVQKFYDAIPTDIKERYIWGNAYNMENLKIKPRDVIVWKKNNFGLGRGYRGQYELCFYYGDFNGSDTDVWEISKDVNYKHPTQKPVALGARAIKNSSKQGDIVLDLFLGSASTMVACHQTNRICFGMELDPRYVDVGIKRMLKLDSNLELKRNGKVIDKTPWLV